MRGERSFRPDIEGLRAVAVLAVVLYHVGLTQASGGYVGVDVFFVVSGFLITGLLWRELGQQGRLSFRSFYARRARRLVPASVLVIAATLVGSWLWLAPLTLRAAAQDGLASALYVANLRFAVQQTGYLESMGSASPFQHYWSLAVEEQFYLVWPVLLVLASGAWRRGRPSVTTTAAALGGLVVVSFAGSLWLTDRSQPWAFFSLPTRAWELGVGALVALGVPVLRRVPATVGALVGWAGLALIGWSVTAFDATTAFPGVAALAPVAGTAAVVIAGVRRGGFGPARVLGWRPLQVIGRLSYSWYLWHWPLLVLGAAAAGRALRTWESLLLVGAAAGLSASTVVAVEAPVRFSPRLSVRPTLSLALAGALSVMAATGGLVAWRTVPPLHGGGEVAAAVPVTVPPASDPAGPPGTRGGATATTVDPQARAALAAMAQISASIERSVGPAPVPSNLDPPLEEAHGDRARPFNDGCFNGFADSGLHRCIYGWEGARARVVLYGDSHATAWFPALEPVADARGWELFVPTKATCPPITAEVWSPNFGRSYRECDTWRAAVLDRIAAERPMLVILGMNRAYGPAYRLQEYGPEWLIGLADTVARVRSTGARVVVLGPTPHQGGDVPDCLSEHLDDDRACAPPVDRAVDAGGIPAERKAVVDAGGDYLDVTPFFCVPTGCPVIVGNLLVWRDQNHVTTSYAGWLAQVLGAQLDLILDAPPPEPR